MPPRTVKQTAPVGMDRCTNPYSVVYYLDVVDVRYAGFASYSRHTMARRTRRTLLAGTAGVPLALATACLGESPATGSGAPPASQLARPGTTAGKTGLLVFGSEGNISTLTTDGKTRKSLTKVPAGALASDPSWSPDGKRIVYSLTPPLPAVRGPGGLIPLPVTDVIVMNADGSDDKVLVAHEAPGVGLQTPVWSPDGKWLYVTYTALIMESNMVKDQVLEVARFPAGGGPRQTIVPKAVFPTVAPDGKRIAYLVDSPNGLGLQTADLDGKNPKTVVPPGTMDSMAGPRFSPDGRQIVFASAAPPVAPPGFSQPFPPPPASGGTPAGAPGTGQLPIAPTATPVSRSGTSGASGALPAAASRAGSLALAMLAAVLTPRTAQAHGLPMDVFVVGSDGTALRRLTTLGEDSPAACWAPDGSRLAILAGGGMYLLSLPNGEPNSIDQRGGHGTIDWQPG